MRWPFFLQNQEMIAEGDLATTMDQSNKIREMQDKIAHLRAQVRRMAESHFNNCLILPTNQDDGGSSKGPGLGKHVT